MGPRLNPNTFLVESISKHRINPDSLQCEFSVKWKGWDKKDNTWEPLSNVRDVPLILRNFSLKSRAGILKETGEISEEAAAAIPNFPQIPNELLAKMKASSDPREFFPTGTETFVRVVSQFVDPNSKLMLWKVYFDNFAAPRFIREAIMSYYWPEDSALFSVHAQHKEERFKHFSDSQGAAKQAKNE